MGYAVLQANAVANHTTQGGKVMETPWLAQWVTFCNYRELCEIFLTTVGINFTFVWPYDTFAHIKGHRASKNHLLSLPTKKGLTSLDDWLDDSLVKWAGGLYDDNVSVTKASN